MSGSNEMKIVMLGKTGSGKSSLGNIILGDRLLKVKSSPESETSECQAESTEINGRRTTVIDPPGFFDTNMSEEKLKREIVKCMVACAPGPHAFVIVLEVSRYTQQEKDVIHKVLKYFSEEALQHAVVVFTHGDQLEEGETIEDFISQNESLSVLVKKCGGRRHVVDNKYWNNNNHDDYRSNQFQVGRLLNTIERMKNRRGYYTNDILQQVQEGKKKTGSDICTTVITKLSCVTVGALLGAFFGAKALLIVPKIGVAAGAIVGGIVGFVAATNASSVNEGVKETIERVREINKIFS